LCFKYLLSTNLDKGAKSTIQFSNQRHRVRPALNRGDLYCSPLPSQRHGSLEEGVNRISHSLYVYEASFVRRYILRKFSEVAFILLMVLGLSPSVHAVPSFTWTEPWNVTLLSNCIPSTIPFNPICGSEPRAFGASATQDGQILDTTADIAVAKSKWWAGHSGGSGGTGLTFSRRFLLSGAAEGWTVSLSGSLNGGITAFGTNSASVRAGASITSSLGINFNAERTPLQEPPVFIVLNQSQLKTAELSDGLYTVAGSLITGSGGGSHLSSSTFFDSLAGTPDGGFRVSVTATPVPEPSTLLLLATGLTGTAWIIKRRY
jgi:hypothetical protein